MFRAALFATTAVLVIAGSTLARADDTGFAYAHDLRKEHGRLCMADHWHSGSGSGRTKAAAQNAAIRSWADFTNFEYGSTWARYSRAASRSVRYTKESSGWGATVDARPCR